MNAKNASENRTVISGQSEIAKGLGGVPSAAAVQQIVGPKSVTNGMGGVPNAAAISQTVGGTSTSSVAPQASSPSASRSTAKPK